RYGKKSGRYAGILGRPGLTHSEVEPPVLLRCAMRLTSTCCRLSQEVGRAEGRFTDPNGRLKRAASFDHATRELRETVHADLRPLPLARISLHREGFRSDVQMPPTASGSGTPASKVPLRKVLRGPRTPNCRCGPEFPLERATERGLGFVAGFKPDSCDGLVRTPQLLRGQNAGVACRDSASVARP